MEFFQLIFLLMALQIVNSANDDNLIVITKLSRSPLMKYYSYSSVMILHFYIPTNTLQAVFKFKAKDEPTSYFVFNCEPRNVSVFMKRGSYPVINPDGIKFPKSFLNISRPEIHELTLKTDSKLSYINITAPEPGDWFAVAFVSWTDPNKDRIEQQGLSSQCEAALYAELLVNEQQDIKILVQDILFQFPLKQKQSQLLKFLAPENIDHVVIEIEILIPCKYCNNENNSDIVVFIQSNAAPDENNYQDKLKVNGSEETIEYLYFWPEEEHWQYLNVTFMNKFNNSAVVKDFAEVGIKLKFISGLLDTFSTSKNTTDERINLFKNSLQKQLTRKTKMIQFIPYKQYNLMRISSSENFMFEYDFRPTKNGSIPLFLNISSIEMTVLKFRIQEIIDIGGTLSLALAIKPNLTNKVATKNVTIVACLRSNIREIPTYPNLCTFENNFTEAPFVLNSSSAGTLKFFHVPYPDPGIYYLSIRAFFDQCSSCNCSDNCANEFNKCFLNCEINCLSNCTWCQKNCEDVVVLENASCADCFCGPDCLQMNETVKNTSIIFSISSHPCITGSCGKRGSCNHYMAGGFIFSSCQCKGGYRGWDCSDDSQVLSNTEVLLAILLLTLSNGLFIPSIYFAYRRNYYTEAVTYFCTMLASIFYHACDSKENQYGFCLFPLGVLQFCDFYCGLLTIWVTLVAMSYTKTSIVSICHIAGAILLAFSVTYNKHALWVFILPAVFGLLLITINWGLKCRQTKRLFPSKTYLKLYMPIGAAFVLMGLISYAFLETKQNYKIVHSLWHIVMAFSVIFLLPNHKDFVPKD